MATVEHNTVERDFRMSAAVDDPGLPDRHTTAGKLADLEARRSEAIARRSSAVDKQHAKGKQTSVKAWRPATVDVTAAREPPGHAQSAAISSAAMVA